MAGTAAKATRRSRFGSVVQRRYVDGYRVANTVNAFGQVIKVGGCVLGLLIFIGVGDALKSPGGGVLLGLIVAALFFVVGIIVAAQGQLLKATLDTAVNSSPFLTDDLRAVIMSLRADERTGVCRNRTTLAMRSTPRLRMTTAEAMGLELQLRPLWNPPPSVITAAVKSLSPQRRVNPAASTSD